MKVVQIILSICNHIPHQDKIIYHLIVNVIHVDIEYKDNKLYTFLVKFS